MVTNDVSAEVVLKSLAFTYFLYSSFRLLQLSNVEIVLANIINHEMEATFDRIVVVGLLEVQFSFGKNQI